MAPTTLTRRPYQVDIVGVMTTNRCLRFALCAFLLMTPLATLAAQEMGDEGSFYVGASYGVSFPGERGLLGEKEKILDFNVGTDFGFLGGQFGVGYSIFGFRPELAVGYRTAPIGKGKVKVTYLNGRDSGAALDDANDALAKVDWKDSSLGSLDVVVNVYYDIDTGTPFLPYLGVGAGASYLTLNVNEFTVGGLPVAKISDSVWAFGFQGAAGIGYAVTEELVLALGYRMTGTTEAELSPSKRKLGLALNHVGELGLRYHF